jgi:hypothetical protein
MFFDHDNVIDKILNPLKISKKSIMEFEIGELHNTGIYRFSKIIEMHVGEKIYVRYLIYSKTENTEYVLELFPIENDQVEAYLFSLSDTIPFSKDFLEVAGQKYLSTPDGEEFERVFAPEDEGRVDGIPGKIKIYDMESEKIEKENRIKIWDYTREVDGAVKCLNLEMLEDTGMFRIFTGEMIEDIFYKVYQGAD